MVLHWYYKTLLLISGNRVFYFPIVHLYYRSGRNRSKLQQTR
nr:MAG TPA: hypothetical protein [Caudoviricetes sp.]